jgi:hypothetical protein
MFQMVAVALFQWVVAAHAAQTKECTMSSVGGSSGSGRSGSSASRSSSTNSVSRTATTTKTATTQTKGLGHVSKDSFAAPKGLPQCQVTPVKGNPGKSSTGIGNDECTFNPSDTTKA